jgi:NAD(P)-dependent dehydrogenase (short-subunit alcohol dehydrogenase family)
MTFTNQVVVVTGASAGIGAALVRELSGRGAQVVLAARRKEQLDQVAASLPSPSLTVVCDVTRRAEVEALREAALARFGRIDVWVNNAGRGISKPLEQLADDDLDAMMRDNVKSALYGMQAVLPHYKARGTGAIVNVSSMLGRVPFATIRSAYCASKAALNSLTETLRFELAQSHPQIKVVLVLPGVVATDFGNNALGGGPDSRTFPGAQPVDEVARVIADGIEAGRADVYTRPDYVQMAIGHLQRLAQP